jgi:uncharacterized protein (TIGR03437 family)
VLLNGKPAHVVGVKANTVNILVPNDLGGAAEVHLEIEHQGRRTTPITLAVSGADPAVFVSTPYGRGNAQARNEDGTANDPQHAAARGSVVTLYTTGISVTGNLPVEAHVGGHPAEVLSIDLSATQPGVVEVKLRVPQTLDAASFHPVVLHVGDLFSQPGVGLAIR